MKSLMQVTDDLINEATDILREPAIASEIESMHDNESSRLEKQILEEVEVEQVDID